MGFETGSEVEAEAQTKQRYGARSNIWYHYAIGFGIEP